MSPNSVCWSYIFYFCYLNGNNNIFSVISAWGCIIQNTEAVFKLVPHDQWTALQWRHNGRDSVSNHQPYDCLLNRLFRRRSKKTSKIRGIGLCAGNSPVTGKLPAQMASHAENVSIWWRHHELELRVLYQYRGLTWWVWSMYAF